MLKKSNAFSGFSVNNLEKAKVFYGEILGIEVEQTDMGLQLNIAGSTPIFVYEKADHQPATFTILNFPVDHIDEAIEALAAKGIQMEQYDLGNGAVTDEKGVLRGKSYDMGPDIAWFKDPSGNILSILEN